MRSLYFASSSVDAWAEMSVKAFELVPAVERDLLMGDKARINIECIECCGKHLYLGTNDCFIHHFLLDEVTSSKGKLSYSAQKLLHKYLGLKKPVAELRAASALERLIVLCDGIVFLVDMVTLETMPSGAGGGAKIRGVTAFCVNENPVNGDPFCVEMGVLSSKRRTVQIYMVHEDRVQLVKEVTTPEQPCAVSVDGYFLCVALATQYMILNYNTGASQDLFPYNSERRTPIVKRIGREEFLLAAPGGLGTLGQNQGSCSVPEALDLVYSAIKSCALHRMDKSTFYLTFDAYYVTYQCPDRVYYWKNYDFFPSFYC